MSVQTIAPARLAELMAREKGVEFIDVRTPAEYESIHAEGTRLVPLDSLDPGKFQPGKPLYVICKAGVRGAKACEKLAAAGIRPVINVEGGTDAWAAAGLPVTRGRHTISLERQVRIAAGSLVLLGVIFSYLIHPGFIALSAFVGAGLIFSGVTDTCGMGMMIAKAPWNR